MTAEQAQKIATEAEHYARVKRGHELLLRNAFLAARRGDEAEALESARQGDVARRQADTALAHLRMQLNAAGYDRR